MLVWIVGNISVWWKLVPTHAISVVLALVASVNSVIFAYFQKELLSSKQNK